MNFPNPFRRARKEPVVRYSPAAYLKPVSASYVVPPSDSIIPPPGTKPVYTMAMLDGENAEISMYGEIVETRPRHPWTGEPIQGDYIIQSEFLKDLETVANAKAITLHIHSIGGDAGVSVLIHNRLRELAAKGTRLVCVVDGVAMSGGSLIMAACDEIRVNPSSLIMIHKSILSLWCSCNADDMRQYAAELDAWDKAQVSIYKRKCGLSETVISNMMAKTTYMTGTEAVEKGFADKLLEDAEPLNIAASADGRSLFVRDRNIHLTPGVFAPDFIPTVSPEVLASDMTDKKQPGVSGNEGGETTMPRPIEEIRAELAEAMAAVSASGTAALTSTLAPVPAPVQQSGADDTSAKVQAERKRLQEIDEVAPLYDEETVREAKYGEHPCTAQEMAYRAAQKAVKMGRDFLTDVKADFNASGAGAVRPVPPSDDKEGTNMLEQARADARAFNERGKEIR